MAVRFRAVHVCCCHCISGHGNLCGDEMPFTPGPDCNSIEPDRTVGIVRVLRPFSLAEYLWIIECHHQKLGALVRRTRSVQRTANPPRVLWLGVMWRFPSLLCGAVRLSLTSHVGLPCLLRVTSCKQNSPIDMRLSARHGFTLVELIVVIGVVGIIAALLLPVLGRTKVEAQRVVCASNLRQINFGIRMYSDDSDDKAPLPNGTWTNKVLSFAGYKKLIRAYVNPIGNASSKAKLFACPADKFFYDVSNGLVVVRLQAMHDQPLFDFSSYSFNGGNLLTNLSRYGIDLSHYGIAGRRIGSIRDPTKTVLVAEVSAYEPWSWHDPKRPLCKENSRFNDARNMVSFVDGHVSYIQIFWTDTSVTRHAKLPAAYIDPPPGYPYQWNGE